MFIEIGNLSGNKEAQHKALYDIAGLMLWEAIEEDDSPSLTRDIKNLIHVFGLVDTACMCSDLDDDTESNQTLIAIQAYVNKERGYA
jgi:hypothetical protein